MIRPLTDAEIADMRPMVVERLRQMGCDGAARQTERLIDEVTRVRALLKRCAAVYDSVPTGDGDEDNQWKCAICDARTSISEDHVPHAADCELAALIGK